MDTESTTTKPARHRDVELLIRGGGSDAGSEFYITARADPSGRLNGNGRDVFHAIARTLRAKRAWIAQERIFCSAEMMPALLPARSEAYGNLDDRVPPTWLDAGPDKPFLGAQVYAVCLPIKPRPLTIQGRICGRMMHHHGCRWITGSGLPVNRSGSRDLQARRAFEETQILLKSAGTAISSLARTWCYLDDILAWYPDFNSARSRFFAGVDPTNVDVQGSFPASTGIGVSPAGGDCCAVDFFAVAGCTVCPRSPRGCLCRHASAGRQRSAFEYGSSFSRASTVCTPSGRTVFVSGTAAIDEDGTTRFPGDPAAQIRMTMDCIHAVLSDLHCPVRDVTQAVAYCKDAEVEADFRRLSPRADWPWIIVRGDICRDDLLFEAEVTGLTSRSGAPTGAAL